MLIPQELKYTADHEWVKIDGNTATVGITDFAQKELGDIVYVEIETEGAAMKHGSVFGTVEAVKTVSDLFLPLTGTITEVNPELGSAPDLVNTDPYSRGWMIKIEFIDAAEIETLLTAEQYLKLIGA